MASRRALGRLSRAMPHAPHHHHHLLACEPAYCNATSIIPWPSSQRRRFWGRPTAVVSAKQKEEESLDATEILRRRTQEKIKEELRRGYFWELGQVNRTKGKLFDADKELLSVDQSFPFPTFKADSLLGVEQSFDSLLTVKNQVTMVAISFRDSGFTVLPSWIEPFRKEFLHVPAMQVYQVNFEDKTWLKVMKFLLVNGQRSQIDRERHGHSFLRFGCTQAIREALRIENRLVGYVFLVDSKGRVRWRGTGSPREDELTSLVKCGRELLDECRLPDHQGRRFADTRHQPRRRFSSSGLQQRGSDSASSSSPHPVAVSQNDSSSS